MARSKRAARRLRIRLVVSFVALFVLGMVVSTSFADVGPLLTTSSGPTTTEATSSSSTATTSTDTTSTGTTAPSPPTASAASVSTDRSSYIVGDTVVLSGVGRLPAESVHVHVADTGTGASGWVFDTDVTAAAD